MPRPKKLVSELLEAAVSPDIITARRPDLPITKEMAEAVWETVRIKGGELVLELPVVVGKFGLSSSYQDPKRSQLLASSLFRKMIGYNVPVKVGARDHGKYLVFSLIDDRGFAVIRTKQKALDSKKD